MKRHLSSVCEPPVTELAMFLVV